MGNASMSNETNTLIGHILQVTGKLSTAKLLEEDEGFQPVLTLGGESQQIGRVGGFVTVRQGKVRILNFVRDIAPPPGCYSRTAAGCVISLHPLGEVLPSGGFQRGIRNYPTPGAEVHCVLPEEINALFVKTRHQRFNFGYLPNHPSISVYLDASTLFSRHFAILGQSGAGKSWAVASLLQKAVKLMPRAHIILLDLHGEYCWGGDGEGPHSAFDARLMRQLDARTLEIPYWLMSFAELVDFFIDRNDPGASVQMAYFRQSILQLKNKSARELGLESVNVDTPIYFSLAELYKHFKDANEMTSDFGKTRGPLFGQFDEMLIKMSSKINDSRYDFLLSPRQRNHSNSLINLLRDFVGLSEPKSPITVIDLSSVPHDVLPMVSAQIGRLAFEFNFWNPQRLEFPILLVCEEAHAYIPRESRTQFEGTRKSMERIAKEGRKFGVGLGVVSQRPHDLSESVLSQCGTFICLRISNPDDQAYIKELVPEDEGDLLDMMSALDRGEAMVFGEGTPLPMRFNIFKPDPPPNSRDADFQGAWTHGPDDIDVESIVRRWRGEGSA